MRLRKDAKGGVAGAGISWSKASRQRGSRGRGLVHTFKGPVMIAEALTAALDPVRVPSKPKGAAQIDLCAGSGKYLGVDCPGCLSCRPGDAP